MRHLRKAENVHFGWTETRQMPWTEIIKSREWWSGEDSEESDVWSVRGKELVRHLSVES